MLYVLTYKFIEQKGCFQDHFSWQSRDLCHNPFKWGIPNQLYA